MSLPISPQMPLNGSYSSNLEAASPRLSFTKPGDKPGNGSGTTSMPPHPATLNPNARRQSFMLNFIVPDFGTLHPDLISTGSMHTPHQEIRTNTGNSQKEETIKKITGILNNPDSLVRQFLCKSVEKKGLVGSLHINEVEKELNAIGLPTDTFRRFLKSQGVETFVEKRSGAWGAHHLYAYHPALLQAHLNKSPEIPHFSLRLNFH